MISSDKLITFGANAAFAAGLYCLGGHDLSKRALCGNLGGIAASTLFQAYYPEYCNQIREKTGENFNWAVSNFYPGVVFLGGLVGGLPYNINLLVTGTFWYASFFVTMFTWDIANEARSKEAEALCKEAEKHIQEGRLQLVGDLLDQAEALKRKLTKPNGWGHWRIKSDEGKIKLVDAYLKLATPNFEEAKKWAYSIENAGTKIRALTTLGNHLINLGTCLIKDKAASDQIEVIIADCDAIFPIVVEDIFILKLKYATEYKKPAVLSDLKDKVSSLEIKGDSICALFSLIEKGLELKQEELVKACIDKVEQNLDAITTEQYLFSGALFPYIEDVFKDNIHNTIVRFLINSAAALSDWDVAERLLNNKWLQGNYRILAEIELGKAYIEHSTVKAKQHIQQAIKLIEERSFPADLEERELKIQQFQQKFYEKVFSVQVIFDLEEAYETAGKLAGDWEKLLVAEKASKSDETSERAREILLAMSARFETLSRDDRLLFMELYAKLHPDALIKNFEKYGQAICEKTESCDYTFALSYLAEAHMTLKHQIVAQQLLEKIESNIEKLEDTNGGNLLASRLISLRRELRALEPAPKRYWIF